LHIKSLHIIIIFVSINNLTSLSLYIAMAQLNQAKQHLTVKPVTWKQKCSSDPHG